MDQTNQLPEPRYESLEIIVKERADGESWFDIISEVISKDCEGSDETDCTCGLESMGGCSGTLDQCYRSHGIADDLVGPVNKADLLLVLDYLLLTQYHNDDATYEAAKRLRNECTWWDETKAMWLADDDEGLITMNRDEEEILDDETEEE